MSEVSTKRTRLTIPQRMRVIALLARGDTVPSIQDYLLSAFSITISDSAIHQIRTTHGDTIMAMQTTIADHELIEAEDILRRSRRSIAKKLTKAERDETELAVLHQQYRDSIITLSEYNRKKAGLLNLSIQELNAVSKGAFAQTARGKAADAPPPALPSSTREAADALVEAVRKGGNTVELQRLVFSPKGEK